MKKAAMPPPAAPASAAPIPSDADWRERMHTAMVECGLQFSADAVAQSDLAMVNGELVVTTAKQFQLDLGRTEIMAALKHMGHTGLRFKIVFGDVKPAPAMVAKPPAQDDELKDRAMAHPEVQRFRELFGGEVRTVRNLKEN